MKVEWDYTGLADAYRMRPPYADEAIDEFLRRSGTAVGDPVCDVGAGTGILTLALARRELIVRAVEPNVQMMRHGVHATAAFPSVRWHEAVAEETGQPAGAFQLVAFGSSFNVTDRPRALRETARILRPGGWFVCLFNHRDLSDPVQAAVQQIIERLVPDFQHGTRREDQAPVIAASGRFGPVQFLEGNVTHCVTRGAYLEAWRSHCTLQRQAGERFPEVLEAIGDWLETSGPGILDVPYHTRVWLAPRA